MVKTTFHDPGIPRPQDEYWIRVDNSNQPFKHAWLEKSDDGQKLIHPLEKLSVLEFVDKDCGDIEPIKPPSIDCTPFKIVEDVTDLKQLVAKLRDVQEFAVDLEHNQYRSFQGLTCLMQISTRTEDFVLDTLKLRVYVGPYLREVFKDPTKRKVMHGADGDVLWLQRDFGIYICNLFDTCQASRVLNLERNCLEYLLQHYCGVTADKHYQRADWRRRPLPDEMLRYAREDTHYLLFIYDLMRKELFGLPKDPQDPDTPLLKVYRRSCSVCMKLYEKELWTENSFLNIHGLESFDFNSLQLAVVSGLYGWRDYVARTVDESTGFVLPNRTLLKIAEDVPVTVDQLRSLTKSRHPYVEWYCGNIINIIIGSMEYAYLFETAAQELKKGRVTAIKGTLRHQNKSGQLEFESNSPTSEFPQGSLNISQQNRGANTGISSAAKNENEEIKPEQIEDHTAQKHANDPGSMRCNDQKNTNQLRENSLASNTSVKEEDDVSELSSKFERMLPAEESK